MRILDVTATEFTFAGWLRDEMAQHRVSQREVALRAGLDHSALSRILRGREPYFRTAVRLAGALGYRITVEPR